MSTPMSEIGEIVERSLSHGDTLMGARLILGTVDDEPATPATGGGDTQLISGTVDVPGSGDRVGPSYQDPVGIPEGAGNAGTLPAGGGDTQLILGTVDMPEVIDPVGPTVGTLPSGGPVPATGGDGAELGTPDPLSAFGTGATASGGDMQLITGTVGDLGSVVSSSGSMLGASPDPAGTSGTASGGDTQLITGTVDDPDPGAHAIGPSLHAAIGATDPTGSTLGNRSTFDDMRLISEPVGTSPLGSTNSAAVNAAYAGAIGIGTSAAAQGQLHQLVTAMAGFGGDQSSPVTSSIAQTEVEGARAMLAASLHY